MLLFLLSLGGIPFVAGFWAKLYVFWAAAERGLYWLVLLGAVLTVVALFYYLLRRQAHVHRGARAHGPSPRGADPGPARSLLCALGVVVLGLYPKAVVMAALRVAHASVLTRCVGTPLPSRPLGSHGDAALIQAIA